MLANGKAEYAPHVKETRMMESTPMHSLDSLTSPRILNSHLPFKQLPRDLISRRCKMVYLLRNPKDICVSFYHHLTKKISFNYEAPWNDYFPMFLGSKCKYVLSLFQHPALRCISSLLALDVECLRILTKDMK